MPARFAVALLAAVALSAAHATPSPASPAPPVLAFSTFLGSVGDEGATAVAVDAAGNVFVAGETSSTSFPVVAAAQPARAGGLDLFVAKLSPDGRSLLYATYFGGSGDDVATGIAVDSAGSAYVTGRTESLDYPTTPGAYDRDNGRTPTCVGGDCIDSFVTKLSADGALVYSTYLGGEHDDYGEAIAVDAEGNAYVTGTTNSFGFPRVNAFEPDKKLGAEAFVTKLDATGGDVVYSSYIGGNRGDGGAAIAVDPAGNAVFVGSTFSNDFLVKGPLQPANAGGTSPEDSLDAFVARVDPSGGLVFSTYLGGVGRDVPHAVAVGPNGAIAVGGETLSAAFPTSAAAQPSLAGGTDGFVAVLAEEGAVLMASTYLGGARDDAVTGVAFGAGGRVVAAGATRSADFPVVAPAQAACASCVAPGFFADAFVSTYDPAGAGLDFSTFLGGTASEESVAVALAEDGAAVVAGRTFSTSFPTTEGVFQRSCPCAPGSSENAFVARFAAQVEPVTPPSIARVDRFKRPFRLEIAGEGFQPGAAVYVGADQTPWPSVEVAGATRIAVGGGRALKARLPKRVAVPLRVVNPDGGEATVVFTR